MTRTSPMLRDLRALGAHFRDEAEAVLRFALSGAVGNIALVSSFGADSAVLLHMVSRIAPATPVLFIDTQMLFPETLEYQRTLADHLGLSDLRVVRAADLARADPGDSLHRTDPDACCDLRKTAPLEIALAGFHGWITGRKRAQGGLRAAMDAFEHDPATGHLKINPLAAWDSARLRAYLDDHALPRHPLVARGYPSIGCAPCTSPVAAGESPRAGRWRGQGKDECGIHIVDGRVVRGSAA